jgi:DNA-directed RNA polymerase alpha subunit
MDRPAQYEFLDKPLNELHLSPELGEVLTNNGFNSVREVVAMETYQLLQLPGFGYRMLHEFIALLKQHNAIHLLKE